MKPPLGVKTLLTTVLVEKRIAAFHATVSLPGSNIKVANEVNMPATHVSMRVDEYSTISGVRSVAIVRFESTAVAFAACDRVAVPATATNANLIVATYLCF